MNNIKNVITFEYMNVFKTKGYWIGTAFNILILVVLNFLPQIIGFFDNGDEGARVAIVDNTGNLPASALSAVFEGFEFSDFASRPAAAAAIEDGAFDFGFYIYDTTHLMGIYPTGADYVLFEEIQALMTGYAVLAALADLGLSPQEITAAMNVEITAGIDLLGAVNGGFFGNFEGPNIVGLVAAVIVGMAVMGSAATVLASIMNEKSTRTVELIFTSTRPNVLMFGKVISQFLLILTSSLITAVVALTLLFLTDSAFLEFISPEVLSTLLDPLLYIFVFILFTAAYLSYAFLSAGSAAAARDIAEGSFASSMPTFLCLGALYLAIFVNVHNPLLDIMAFVPFFSPFIVLVRISMYSMTQLLLMTALNIAYTLVIGWVAAKVYQMYIMLYGHKVTLPVLVKNLFAK